MVVGGSRCVFQTSHMSTDKVNTVMNNEQQIEQREVVPL